MISKRFEHTWGFEYLLKNEPHRTNGPGIRLWKGEWYWFLFGKWHRYYGPVSHGNNWFIHGKKIK